MSQECLEIEFGLRNVPCVSKCELKLFYKGTMLRQRYIPDFICFGKIVVEIKAVSKLADEHRAQIHNYLKATGYKVGLLANFGRYPQIEHERIIR